MLYLISYDMRDNKDENYHKYAVKEGKVKLLLKKISKLLCKIKCFEN